MAMITWDWVSELTENQDTEMRLMLEAAEDYDLEQGFSVVDYKAVKSDLKDSTSPNKLMLVYYDPLEAGTSEQGKQELILASVLRAEVGDDGNARVNYTVNPDLRSLGITTLLVEEIGFPGQVDGAWVKAGVNATTTWARGNHPAADRLSNRFDIPATQHIWRLFRELKQEDRVLPTHDYTLVLADGASDEIHAYEQLVENTNRPASGLAQDVLRSDRRVLVATDSNNAIQGVVSLDLKTSYDLNFGRWGDIDYISTHPEAEERLVMWLLHEALQTSRELPMDAVVLHLEPEDEGLVHAARVLGFVHDRTDVAYSL